MIISVEPARASISIDDGSARYPHSQSLRRAQPGLALGADAAPVRALVELRLQQGGMAPRALLGGEFTPSEGTETTFEVMVAAEPLALGRSATCRSELGLPLVAGLPAEFAESVLTRLAVNGGARPLPSGIFRVDRAGHDEVESSPWVFGRAARLLRRVIDARLRGLDPAVEARAELQSWG